MKEYFLYFGDGDPRYKGLAPTFTVFKTIPGGANVTPPAISELPAASGRYFFAYGPTTSIAFVVDGATSLLSTKQRYIAGLVDPIQAVDELIGLTLYPLYATLGGAANAIGFTGSTFGGLNTDPTTVFGYEKRLQEFNEGNSILGKTSGTLDFLSRGSSTLLAEKTLVDNSSTVTKT